jgi:3-isopropylmalate/(R)-2-methylmalate dehydratase large subunit
LGAVLQGNAENFGFASFGNGSNRQGIVHVVGPELGLTLPGALVVCGDSHTATHGALGCLAFGIGSTEIAHVLGTQTIWQKKAKTFRFDCDGELGFGVTAKDLILHLIAMIGTRGGTGHVIEFGGSAIRSLSLEGRMTVCNMSIEAGAKAGMVAPDQKTLDYVNRRLYAPEPKWWQSASEHWLSLASDSDAKFDREVGLNVSAIDPTVTWGTSPQTALSIAGHVPLLEEISELETPLVKQMLDYMGLEPGRKLRDVAIDQVFIGSCTNSRIEDLRLAASVVKKNKARVKVPSLVVPGSVSVQEQAQKEGLDQIFKAAGFEWASPGCSMCVGMNGDKVGPGKRSVSTSNRNFMGRQGQGSRTHLASPLTAAASALTGYLTDVREIL